MYVLSIISFLLWAGFLLLAAMRFGVPAMVSDVYYQLQNCTGSEAVGDKRKQNGATIFVTSGIWCYHFFDEGKMILLHTHFKHLRVS